MSRVGLSVLGGPVAFKLFLKEFCTDDDFTIDECVEKVFRKWHWLVGPIQNKTEISQLFHAVEQINPKVILEIGTNLGGTLFLTSRIATCDALIISIDLPGGIH